METGIVLIAPAHKECTIGRDDSLVSFCGTLYYYERRAAPGARRNCLRRGFLNTQVAAPAESYNA